MMSTKMQIQNFNQKLIDENVEINIIDYVKLLNNESYHINILFIDDFVNLVDKDDFCISHDMLFKYGILSYHNTYNIKRLLDQYHFVENEHYKIKLIDEVNKKVGRPQITYMLHADSFK